MVVAEICDETDQPEQCPGDPCAEKTNEDREHGDWNHPPASCEISDCLRARVFLHAARPGGGQTRTGRNPPVKNILTLDKLRPPPASPTSGRLPSKPSVGVVRAP